MRFISFSFIYCAPAVFQVLNAFPRLLGMASRPGCHKCRSASGAAVAGAQVLAQRACARVVRGGGGTPLPAPLKRASVLPVLGLHLA